MEMLKDMVALGVVESIADQLESLCIVKEVILLLRLCNVSRPALHTFHLDWSQSFYTLGLSVVNYGNCSRVDTRHYAWHVFSGAVSVI